jgi:hypothetical protein
VFALLYFLWFTIVVAKSTSLGGGILSGAKTESKLRLGENVIIVELIFQILFFGLFVVVSVIFHKRTLDNPTSASMTVSVNWNWYLIVLYIASGLIMVRCVYRVVEYVQGQTGVLQSYEYLSTMLISLIPHWCFWLWSFLQFFIPVKLYRQRRMNLMKPN